MVKSQYSDIKTRILPVVGGIIGPHQLLRQDVHGWLSHDWSSAEMQLMILAVPPEPGFGEFLEFDHSLSNRLITVNG